MKTVKDIYVWIATAAGGLLVLSFFAAQSRGHAQVLADYSKPIDRNLVFKGLREVHASLGPHPRAPKPDFARALMPVPPPKMMPAKALPMTAMRVPAPAPDSKELRAVASLEVAEHSLVEATEALETAKAELYHQMIRRG